MSYNRTIVDQNDLIYQKVKKVFDLMKELDITFWIDKHSELRCRENSTNRHYDDFYISDFVHNGCCFPTEELEIYENIWEEEEEELQYYIPSRLEVLISEIKDFSLRNLFRRYEDWKDFKIGLIIDDLINNDENYHYLLDQITLNGITLRNFPKEFQHQTVNEFKVGVVGIDI